MSERSVPVRTDEANWKWSKKAIRDYINDNYEFVTPEDRLLGSLAVMALATHARERGLYGQVHQAATIATCGVPRAAAILSPLVSSREHGGQIEASDREETTVEATKDIMAELALGQLGIWRPHQKIFAQAQSRWRGSFVTAGSLAVVRQLDAREMKKHSQEALGLEFFHESATSVEDEYDDLFATSCDALVPGGILYGAYMRGSKRYAVGGEWQPATPVDADRVGRNLKRNNMHVLMNAVTDASHMARSGEDAHEYDGMGAYVAIKQ